MSIRNITVILFACIGACSLVACGGAAQSFSPSVSPSGTVLTETDRGEAEKIVDALSGSLMLGRSWSKITGEDYKYDLSLTTFYCILNPDYSADIPAAAYEAFIQMYFDTSEINLREMGEYNPENETYAVSVDISIDRANAETEEYFRIDQIEYAEEEIKVSYHTIWGGMAPHESMVDSVVLAGYILLDKEDGYRVLEVRVTEDHSVQ